MQTLAKSLRERCHEQREALKAAYLAQAKPQAQPQTFLALRSQQVDTLLRELWQAVNLPKTVTLAAVGGYGRGELYPHSDVDLLILLTAPPNEALEDKLKKLVSLFWDIGLEIGHSVRTIDECLTEAAADVTIETALLESRHITGNETLFQELHRRINLTFDPLRYFHAKIAEQHERHRRFNDTPYSLEPNCKESPGGLRDLQIIGWLSKAAGHATHMNTTCWDELHASGFITAHETKQLKKCEHLLQDLRIRLHFHSGRREDRLIFDVQKAMAGELGFRAKDDRRASERMMQAYYKNAKSVAQLNTLLLQNIADTLIRPENAPPPEPINEDFQIVGDLLDIRRKDVFSKNPSRLLDSFHHMQQYPHLRGMTVRTLRSLWRERNHIDDQFRANPVNRQRFLSLFQGNQHVVDEFRRMNQWSVLGRYLPAFGRIVGQMQHDLFHVFTVDQHILLVLQNVRRFALEKYAHEYPYEYRLLNAFDKPWLIYIAALFHDIAKGRGGDHSQLGMVDTLTFCVDHGLNEEDTELVVWLVREHLTLSRIAQKEDISDPIVIKRLSETVRDERHLTALYLLTVADIRGTSPKTWNAWKANLMIDLYETTREVLRAGKPPEAHGLIAERQNDAMRLIRFFALPDTVKEQLWKQLDSVYFMRNTAEEIAWHTRALHYRMNNDEPIVKARLIRPHKDINIDEESEENTAQIKPASDAKTEINDVTGIQVMVYTRDQKELFLRLAGFFARTGFSIADAKIHTTSHGYALDSFVLLDVQNRDTQRELISYIEYELTERLTTQAPPDVPPAGRISRQVRHFPIQPEVEILPDDRGSNYILSLTAADRPGLLFSVAATIARHGAQLLTAKIATLGERAEDTFLISGGDLTESTNRIKLETELREQLKI